MNNILINKSNVNPQQTKNLLRLIAVIASMFWQTIKWFPGKQF